jgi:hypothetical protein
MRRAAPVLAALLAIVLVTDVAGAHKARFASVVTIHVSRSGGFGGSVYSIKPRCEKHRLVKLVAETAGDDEAVGDDRTDSKGRWKVNITGSTGYYAHVTRKVLTRPGHRHVCRGDRSRVIEG